MSKRDILNWFGQNSDSLTVDRILVVLCVALIISAVIFITYKISYTGVSYNARFNASNMLIVLITAVIMMMIGSNIAISLGMVGALSIVRFRTAIKDPQDTIYIFWAIVEGLCVGAHVFVLAIISTAFIAIVLVALSFYTSTRSKYIIIIRGSLDVNKSEIMDKLSESFKNVKIRAVNNREESCEIIAQVSVSGKMNIADVDCIKSISGVKSANWVLETGMGQ